MMNEAKPITLEEISDSRVIYQYPNRLELYGNVKNSGDWRISTKGSEPLLRQRILGVVGGEEETWRLVPTRFSFFEAKLLIELAEKYGMYITSFNGKKFINSMIQLRDKVLHDLTVVTDRLGRIYDSSLVGGSLEYDLLRAKEVYLRWLTDVLQKYISEAG